MPQLNKYANLYSGIEKAMKRQAYHAWELEKVVEPLSMGMWFSDKSGKVKLVGIDSSKSGFKSGFRIEDVFIEINGERASLELMKNINNGKEHFVTLKRENAEEIKIKFIAETQTILRPVHKK